MRLVARDDLLATLRVAFALIALGSGVSLLVHLAAADDVRAILGFTFPGVPARLSEAWAILSNNLRIMLAVVFASGVAQAAIRTDADGFARGVMTAIVRFCEIGLLLWCLVQVAIIGAALGAYGGRALWPILAHLPFELGAFSLVLAVYLKARRQRLEVRDLTATALAAALLLALGAVVEVYA